MEALDQAKVNLAKSKQTAGVEVKDNDHQRGRYRKRRLRTCSGENQTGDFQSPLQPGSAQVLSRANGRRGTTSLKTTQNKCVCTGITCSQHRRNARFWLGPANITLDDIAQGPSCHDADAHPLKLKWLHTIVHDPTYLSECAAIDQARHLAWTLGCSLPMILSHDVEKPEPCRAKPTCKYVNFADCVDVCIFSEVSPISVNSQVNYRNVHATILSGTANFANFVSNQKGMTFDHIPQFWPTKKASATDRSTTVWHLAPNCSRFSFDHEATTHDHELPANFERSNMDLQHSMIEHVSGHEVTHASNCEGRQGTAPTKENSSLVGYPDQQNHEVATPHNLKMRRPVHFDDAQPIIHQYRLEHQSPLDELDTPDDQSDEEQETPGEDDDTYRRRPYQPAFASRLEALLRARNLHPDDGDFDLPVRTWYINHNTVHRWTSPRLLQLVGQPHTWEAQITSLWIDQIDDQDWYDVVVVQPDPPRIPRHHFVVLDLIVTQSLESTRQPGLITVLPTRPEIGDMYAVAGSFPDTISGQDVIRIADAGAFCRYRICTITHRWQQIPLTLTPAHIVGPGDGYQIVIHVPRITNPPSDTDVHDDQSRCSPIEQAAKRSRSEPASSSTGPGPSAGSTIQDTTPMLHIFQFEGHLRFLNSCCPHTS